MRIWLFILCFVSAVLSCRNDNLTLPINATLLGEWRYVGVFSHAADYGCLPCPGFNYEEAPRLMLHASGELEGNALLNQYGGKYRATVEDSSRFFQSGKFWLNLRFRTEKAGTPAQTQAENDFFDRLSKTNNYYISFSKGAEYTGLTLNQPNSGEYLYFVRRK